MHEDPSMLSRLDLNKGWAQYLFHQIGFVTATTKAIVTMESFTEFKVLEIKNVIEMDDIQQNY